MVKNMKGSHDTWPASMSYFQACPSALRTGGALIIEVPISLHVLWREYWRQSTLANLLHAHRRPRAC